MSRRTRIGVLISGRGSNMSCLIDACNKQDYPAEIVSIISNRPRAPGLQIARKAGLRARAIDHKKYASREAFEADLNSALEETKVELLCMAGFMRLLTGSFVDQWRDRQINIHPSLLPAFKGLDTHARVLQAGVPVTGCTVHFVREEMDTGPIIAQAEVAVQADDTPETLASRVLKAEHKLYPQALALVASGQARVEGERVIFK